MRPNMPYALFLGNCMVEYVGVYSRVTCPCCCYITAAQNAKLSRDLSLTTYAEYSNLRPIINSNQDGPTRLFKKKEMPTSF